MANKLQRTFNFDRSLWEKLDADADSCLRSSTKQLEAILRAYYFAESFEMNYQKIEVLGELMRETPNKEKKAA